MNEFKVTKESYDVRVFLVDGVVLEGAVFLAEFAAHHAGQQTVEDLLREEKAFFPLKLKDGGVELIHKAAVTHIQWTPGQARAENNEAEIEIMVTFTGGATVEGLLRILLPPGQQRLQDFINQVQPFFSLDAGATQYVINRDQIRQIRNA